MSRQDSASRFREEDIPPNVLASGDSIFRKNVLRSIERELCRMGLEFKTDHVRGVISMVFRRVNENCLLTIKLEEGNIVFLTMGEGRIPEHMRPMISELVHCRNRGFRAGNLDYDGNEGILWFRMTEHLGNGHVVPDNIRYNVITSLREMDSVLTQISNDIAGSSASRMGCPITRSEGSRPGNSMGGPRGSGSGAPGLDHS